jgi:hypothetical protein
VLIESAETVSAPTPPRPRLRRTLFVGIFVAILVPQFILVAVTMGLSWWALQGVQPGSMSGSFDGSAVMTGGPPEATRTPTPLPSGTSWPRSIQDQPNVMWTDELTLSMVKNRLPADAYRRIKAFFSDARTNSSEAGSGSMALQAGFTPPEEEADTLPPRVAREVLKHGYSIGTARMDGHDARYVAFRTGRNESYYSWYVPAGALPLGFIDFGPLLMLPMVLVLDALVAYVAARLIGRRMFTDRSLSGTVPP